MHKHSDVVHILTQLVARGVLADQVSLKGLVASLDDGRGLATTRGSGPVPARVVRVHPAAFHVARTYFSYSRRR